MLREGCYSIGNIWASVKCDIHIAVIQSLVGSRIAVQDQLSQGVYGGNFGILHSKMLKYFFKVQALINEDLVTITFDPHVKERGCRA